MPVGTQLDLLLAGTDSQRWELLLLLRSRLRLQFFCVGKIATRFDQSQLRERESQPQTNEGRRPIPLAADGERRKSPVCFITTLLYRRSAGRPFDLRWRFLCNFRSIPVHCPYSAPTLEVRGLNAWYLPAH